MIVGQNTGETLGDITHLENWGHGVLLKTNYSLPL
jgi:hypothetical protein